MVSKKWNWVVPEKIHTPLSRGNQQYPPPPLPSWTSYTNLRHSLDNPLPPPEWWKFLCGWGLDLFWNNPFLAFG